MPFEKAKSKIATDLATKGVLGPAMDLAKQFNVMPSRDTLLTGLRKGAHAEICDYIKKYSKMPTVKDVTGSLPPDFIKKMSQVNISKDDMDEIAAKLLDGKSIADFKRYL